MKTPMQELIEQLKEEAQFINDNDSIEDRFYRSGLREAIQSAEQMLEKEKEVMCGIYDDVLARYDHNYIGGEGEQYYNETFNTKEK